MYAGIWFVTESGKPLLSDSPGINAELLILYIALALAFAFIGSGAVSLDRRLFVGKPARKSRR
jgi:putative oxidoreductase